jgi:hypothetical protein
VSDEHEIDPAAPILPGREPAVIGLKYQRTLRVWSGGTRLWYGSLDFS